VARTRRRLACRMRRDLAPARSGAPPARMTSAISGLSGHEQPRDRRSHAALGRASLGRSGTPRGPPRGGRGQMPFRNTSDLHYELRSIKLLDSVKAAASPPGGATGSEAGRRQPGACSESGEPALSPRRTESRSACGRTSTRFGSCRWTTRSCSVAAWPRCWNATSRSGSWARPGR
jgi:hypothetical protein